MSSPFYVITQLDAKSNEDGCFWCGEPCSVDQVCPLSGDVRYCSSDHLKNHFHVVPRTKENDNNNNDRQCLPYRIGFHPERGRFALATRDIEPTELIMADWPMVVGPSRQQKIVCVECLSPVDGSIRCSDCNFPMCSTECATAKKEEDDFGHTIKWHKKYECKLLNEIGFQAADVGLKSRTSASTEVPLLLVQIASLAPYRLLLKGLRQEKGSQDLIRPPLYNFCAPRQETIKIYAFEEDVVDVIWNDFQLKNQISDVNTVRQAIGQLFNNAKSLEKAGHDGTGLFGLYSLLNHSCISNAKCIVGAASRGYPLEVRAQVPISTGEEITTRYVGVNIGAPMRSDILKEHWIFECNCKRCSDPTDCGTFSNALRCPKCKVTGENGYLLFVGPVCATSKEWRCNHCHWNTTKQFVEKIIELGLATIKRITSGTPEPAKLEELISNLEQVFHSKHYLIQQVKFVLLRVLRNTRDDDIINQRLVDLCYDLLATMDIIDPGASRNRGKILKDLIPSLMRLAQSQQAKGEISEEEFNRKKRQCSDYAKDLVNCFKYEFF